MNEGVTFSQPRRSVTSPPPRYRYARYRTLSCDPEQETPLRRRTSVTVVPSRAIPRDPSDRPQQEFRFDLPKYLSQLSRSDAQIVQVFRAEMVRLAACLGDSGAVEALIRLGLGREDRVLVFRCDFATLPYASGQNGQFLGGAERPQSL